MLLNIVGSMEAEGVLQCFENCDDAFWMQLSISESIYAFFFFHPKIWQFLITRGKNFGGAFFDVFRNLELNSEKNLVNTSSSRPDSRFVDFDCPRL